MKGFVYLIEVAVAGLLIAVTLAAFLSTTSGRISWERSELISLGDSVLWSLKDSGNTVSLLEGNTAIINSMMPSNIRWALHVSNTPKSTINVGCFCTFSEYSRIRNVLEEPSYFNGRLIEFNVSVITTVDEMKDYDVVIFKSPINFDTDNDVKDYLAGGKGVIAFFDMTSSAYSEMKNIFGLQAVASSGSSLSFGTYNPMSSLIEKYFFGFGMPVSTPGGNGIWKHRSVPYSITVSGNHITINSTTVVENSTFSNSGYTFKLKKVWPDAHGVEIQPIIPYFDFKNFIDTEYGVKGTVSNIVWDGSAAAVTANRSAVWISEWSSESDEYGALLRAVIASLTTDWWIAEPVAPRETVTTLNFASLCCDAPETAELTLWLWYVF